MPICCQPGLLIRCIKFQPKAKKLKIHGFTSWKGISSIRFIKTHIARRPLILLLLRKLTDTEIPRRTTKCDSSTHDHLIKCQQKRGKILFPEIKRKWKLSHSLFLWFSLLCFQEVNTFNCNRGTSPKWKFRKLIVSSLNTKIKKKKKFWNISELPSP